MLRAHVPDVKLFVVVSPQSGHKDRKLKYSASRRGISSNLCRPLGWRVAHNLS